MKFNGKITDSFAVNRFIFNKKINLEVKEKLKIVKKLNEISASVECPHTIQEILSFIENILLIPKDKQGCIVEAGCFKGGSTAKFSLAAKIANRNLVVFDSFQGIPEHSENHTFNIYGKPVTFSKGEYCGTINEVKETLRKYGEIDVCQFVEGWFENTLPHFSQPIAAIYIDVDLAASVKTCLKYLYPQLIEGGSLFCQDGHLPLVIDVFNDDSFWIKEVGFEKPNIEGLGKEKLIRIVKPNRSK